MTMVVVIILYDQLMFRPLVAWADKFRFEQTGAQTVPGSWFLDLLQRTVGSAVRIETVAAAGLWPALCDPNQL